MRQVNRQIKQAGTSLILNDAGVPVGSLDQDVFEDYGIFTDRACRALAPVHAGTGVHPPDKEEGINDGWGWCAIMEISAWRSTDDVTGERFCCHSARPGDAER